MQQKIMNDKKHVIIAVQKKGQRNRASIGGDLNNDRSAVVLPSNGLKQLVLTNIEN
jgi:hypothetical protein